MLLHVQVIVEVPRRLSSQQKELLQKFAETEGQSQMPGRQDFFEKLKKYFGNGG